MLGPADDGGYYLIGMRRQQPGLFTDIPWSSSRLVVRRWSGRRTTGLSVAQRLAYDVDTPAELERLREQLIGQPPGNPPCTRAVLDRQ